jgi:hypothetical protein
MDFASIEAGHGTARERLAEFRRQFRNGEFVQVGGGSPQVYRNASTKAFISCYECKVPGLSKEDLYSLADFSRDMSKRGLYDRAFDYGEALVSLPNSRTMILRQCMKKILMIAPREFVVSSYIGDYDGEVYAIGIGVDVDSCPEGSDPQYVRGTLLCGGYAVKYDESQGLLSVQFYAQVDINGNVPEWAVAMGQKTAMLAVQPMTQKWLELRGHSQPVRSRTSHL